MEFWGFIECKLRIIVGIIIVDFVVYWMVGILKGKDVLSFIESGDNFCNFWYLYLYGIMSLKSV